MFNLSSLVYRFVHDSSSIEVFFLFAADKCDSISSYPEGLEKKYCFITALMCSLQLYSSKMWDHSWKIIRYLLLFIFGDTCPGTSGIQVRGTLYNKRASISWGARFTFHGEISPTADSRAMALPPEGDSNQQEEKIQWRFSSSHLGNVCSPGKCVLIFRAT